MGPGVNCYGEGGRSAIYILGEDMPLYIAEGGRGRPPFPPSRSPPSYIDTTRHTLHQYHFSSRSSDSGDSGGSSSTSSSTSSSSISGACNGQQSKYYNHAVCGRGGSRATQNGLVVIELNNLPSSVGPTLRTAQSVPSIMPTAIATESVAPSGQPSNALAPSYLIMVVAPVVFVSVIMLLLLFCLCRKHCSRQQRLPTAVTQLLPDEPLTMATVTVVTSNNTEESLPRSDGDHLRIFMMVDSAENDVDLSMSTAVPINNTDHSSLLYEDLYDD